MNKRGYVYPKLSQYDLGAIRLGGAGLGNILFIYGRALVFAKKNNRELIWPTWASIKVGPYLRKEKDKRFYGDLFNNNSGYVTGIKKIILLFVKSSIQLERVIDKKNIKEDIVIFDKYIGDFKDIRYDSQIIREDLVKNLKGKNRKALEMDFTNSVCVHIRLGDFQIAGYDKLKSGVDNSRIPIDWYIEMVNKVRECIKSDLKVYIFSDGTDEELAKILALENVERLTFGTSIADIIALSRSKLFICSGSTFSMWARYLGRTNTIAFKNQIKEYLLTDGEISFEIELDQGEEIPRDIKEKIRQIYI